MNREYNDDDSDDDKTGTKKLVAPHGHYLSACTNKQGWVIMQRISPSGVDALEGGLGILLLCIYSQPSNR